jgi:hypothetical protein
MPERILVKKRIIVFTLLAVAIAWLIFMMIPVTGSKLRITFGIKCNTPFLFTPIISQKFTCIKTYFAGKNPFDSIFPL